MKKICVALVLLIIIFSLTSCTTSVSYTFNVSTGDNIKVILDTSTEYELSQKDGEFFVMKDGVELTKGIFLTEDQYNSYFDSAEGANGVSSFSSGIYNGNEFISYLYVDKDTDRNTWYHVIKVSESSTGVGLINSSDQSSSDDIFRLLSFSKE